jgi:hypothetical protein
MKHGYWHLLTVEQIWQVWWPWSQGTSNAQMDAQGNTHGQWLTQHQNGIWFLQHWYQSHLVKKVAQKPRTTGNHLLCRTAAAGFTTSMLGIPRMSAVSVQKQFTSSVYWLGEQACPSCWPAHFFSRYSFIGLQNTHSGPFTRRVTCD